MNNRIRLPDTLIHLYKYYEISSNSFKRQYLKKEDDLILISCFKVQLDEYENYISGLIGIEELEREVQKYHNKTDEYHKRGFIKIGYFDLDDILLISLNREDFGVVHILDVDPIGTSKDDKIINLRKDLMKFLDELKEELIHHNLNQQGIESKNIYKNWNAEYWKI
ncbi:MAG: hypothetical protein AAFZ15_06550 [Bacteroidota bacterium]